MSENTSPAEDQIDIILPSEGLLYDQETLDYVLCKPKLLPLKSVTLQQLESMQKDADAKMRAARDNAEDEKVREK